MSAANNRTVLSSAATPCSAASPFYQDARVTIYNAPCEQVLPFLDPVDLVLTDPPYGIGESMKRHGTRQSTQRLPCGPPGTPTEYEYSEWDSQPPPDTTLEQVRQAGKWHIWFGGNFFRVAVNPCWLVWDKDNTGDFADCELAWTNLKGAVRKFKWRWNGMLQERMGRNKEKRYHPTQKPVALMRWAIAQAPDDVATILDPFAGSGTTAIAAVREGKRVILIERETNYCQIAVDRLKAEPVANLF